MAKPVLNLTLEMPSVMNDPGRMLSEILVASRPGQDYDQLLSSSLDSHATRNKSWYETITPETAVDDAADEADE